MAALVLLHALRAPVEEALERREEGFSRFGQGVQDPPVLGAHLAPLGADLIMAHTATPSARCT